MISFTFYSQLWLYAIKKMYLIFKCVFITLVDEGKLVWTICNMVLFSEKEKKEKKDSIFCHAITPVGFQKLWSYVSKV